MGNENGNLEIMVWRSSGDYSVNAKELAENAKNAFAALGDSLAGAVEPFLTKMNALRDSADEVELTFTLAFKGSGNWVLLSAEGSATTSVKLTWKKGG